MESLPTKHPAGRGSTAGLASDMGGPRWKRRSFVDDGIPPNKIPCRSGLHRWNGLRHGWAAMETKIIRGRRNPSRQSTLPVGAPPLEWPPTWLGHDGNENHSWTMESLPTKYPAGRGSTAGMASDMGGPRWERRSFVDGGIPRNKIPCRSGFHRWNGLRHGMVWPRWKRISFVDDGIPLNKIPCRSGFHRWNGLRHGWATMETKILRGRWNPSQRKYPAGRGSTARMPPTWLGHDGDGYLSWTMESTLLFNISTWNSRSTRGPW